MVSASKFDIKVYADKSYYRKGQWGVLTYQITNTGALIVSNIQFRPSYDYGIQIDEEKVKVPVIYAKEVYEYELKFRARFRGLYGLGLVDYWISDYFNLIRFKKRMDIKTDVVFLPNISLSAMPRYEISQSDAERQFGVDFIEQDVLVDIRDYEYGDPLKRCIGNYQLSMMIYWLRSFPVTIHVVYQLSLIRT